MILVWMPIYNEARYLRKAIDSVLVQTHRDFVFVISDNHSTDGSGFIIDEACRTDPRVRKVSPPAHVTSLGHSDFLYAEILNRSEEYEYSIFIGGHDIWQPNLLETLWTRAEASPESAIVFTDSYRIDQHDTVRQKYEALVHVAEIPRSMRVHYVLIGLTFNVVWGGLWRENVRKRVPQRHRCTAVDHLMIAEIALHGNLIYAPGSVVFLRENETPGSDTYVKKHLPAHFQDNPVLDFALQLEWVAYLADKAASMDQFCQQDSVRNMLKHSLLTAYVCRYWYHLASFTGGLETFFKDARVHQVMALAAHGNTMLASFIDDAIALSRATGGQLPLLNGATPGSRVVIADPWPAMVGDDELFEAAAARAEAERAEWFVLADGAILDGTAEAWLATLTRDEHDAVILFRDPEPASPSDAAVAAWIASGVAVFAIRTAWWRQQHAPSTRSGQACPSWAAATVDQLTRSARCYLGSVVR